MKKYKSLILSFIIPVIIMLISLLLNKIYPFGNKILLMLDGYNQYPGFLNTFLKFILGKESILYSFKGITGFNLFASSVYYTFNLTNLFFTLFKTNHIIDFYTFIIIFKMGLASLSMNIFLNNIKKNKYNYIFSICYGLCAYNLLYYLNYMWFDSIIFLPIVMLGIDKIFKNNNYLIYVISLSLAIISNFYIGYMICIFSVIYFIYKWIMNNTKKECLFKFILYSLLAGLISSFILIPAILELLNGKSALFANTNYFKFDLDFINVFYKLTIGSLLNGDLEYGNPNVYVSIFIFFNSVLFFFNKRISKKEKIVCLCIIVFFLLSMSFNLIDYFWQMLQMPIFYPVRYAFIFDFFLIYLAFKNFINYETISFKKNLIIILSMVIIIVIGFITSGNLLDKVNIPAKTIYLLISIMFLVYYAYIQNNDSFKKFIVVVIIIELSVNSFVIYRNNGNITTKTEFNNTYTLNYNILNKLDYKELDKIAFNNRVIRNNGLLLDYNDLNYFSSLRNKKVIEMLNKGLGIVIINDCISDYYYNNPIVNSLLNIKYFITKDTIDYYNLVDTYDEYNIYENKDVTSIGFVTNDLNKLELTDDYITNINNLVKTINNNDKNIIKEINVNDKNTSCSSFSCVINGEYAYINYKYTATKDVFIYVQNGFITTSDKSTYNVKINNKEINYNAHYPLRLKKNDVIEINITPADLFKDYMYHVYEIDYTVYQDFINNINKNKLEITDYKSDANFKGHISLNEDGYLFTSISNDKGWNIYVDGQKQEIKPIYDGLIGINLTKGDHTIEFKYFPPGLRIGLIITSSSILLLIGLELIRKKNIK